MKKAPSWKAALVAAIGIGSVAVLGMNVAAAMSGAESEATFSEGTVIRSSFVIGRGVTENGTPDEVTTESWLKVGPQGEEESLRETVRNASDSVLQDAIRRRVDSKSETYLADIGETVTSARPESVRAVMWSEDSVANELLRNGFELTGQTQLAGLTANVFEQATDIEGELPEALLQAAGIDPQLVAGVVRRVYIGADPFGTDLGEEAGYVLSDGAEFTPYYRRITAWEIVNSEVPAGLFEWSPSVAREAVR